MAFLDTWIDYGSPALLAGGVGTIPTSATLVSMAYGNGITVCLFYSYPALLRSADLATWSEVDLTPTIGSGTYLYKEVLWSGNKFILRAGANYWQSTDGVTWTGLVCPMTGVGVSDYCMDSLSNGTLVVRCSTVAGRYYYSTDMGTTWTMGENTQATTANRTSSGFVYANGKYLALQYTSGSAGYSSTPSLESTDWDYRDNTFNRYTSASIMTMGYGLGGFLAVLVTEVAGTYTSFDGFILKSSDMESWSLTASNLGLVIGSSGVNIYSGLWLEPHPTEPNTAFLIGSGSRFKTTDGGVNWASQAVAYTPTRYIHTDLGLLGYNTSKFWVTDNFGVGSTVQAVATLTAAITICLPKAYPAGDVSRGPWYAGSSFTDPLYPAIDEPVLNSADFVESDSTGTAVIALSPVQYPLGDSPVLKFNAKSAVSTPVTVTLKQGSTVIKTVTQALTTTTAEYSLPLSPTEAALLTSGVGLTVELTIQ